MTAATSLGIVAGLAACLAAVGWFRRAYPTRRLVALAALPTVGSLGLLAWSGFWWPLLVADAVVLVVAAADLSLLPRSAAIRVEREVGRIASLGKPHPVGLVVANASGRELRLALAEDLPAQIEADRRTFQLRLGPRRRATLTYRLRPGRRGAYHLPHVRLRLESRGRLWQRLRVLDCPSTIHVYPDLKQMAEYAVLARTNRLSLLGVRRTRRIGEDNEFERLRDYQRDDDFRHIDWRSTARRQKLTVREFQRNQSQRIFFLIDCGRMMTNQADGLSLLDHALNAMLMMSFVALNHGDEVGLVCFSDEVRSYVPARAGRRQTSRLLHACFDLFPQRVESRYDQAFFYLSRRCRRRALVVLITSVFDDVNRRQIERHLARLAGRHLPLGVLLRDRRVFELADAPPGDAEGLYNAAAAAEILNWRSEVLAELVRRGVLVLDTFPEQLTTPLVNRYLDIKARHLL